jgi:hypothetical protein
VTAPPAPLTAATRSPVAPEELGVSTRTVIAYPGLGFGMRVLSPTSHLWCAGEAPTGLVWLG